MNEKVSKLLDDINVTADEYYENVSFADAYSILVPASSSTVGFIRSLIDSALKPAVILEGTAFLVYLCAAFIYGIRLEKGKSRSGKEEPEDQPQEKKTGSNEKTKA